MRANPVFSELGNFSYKVVRETEYSDIDILEHVNNVAISKYYGDARVRFLAQAFDEAGRTGYSSPSHLVAEMTIKYFAEINYPGPVTIGVGISRIGSSSFTVVEGLYQNDTLVGQAEIQMVATKEGKPTPLPQAVKEHFQQYLIKV
ncbi:MAG: thioesterase family protein [Gammaproteobacteria bacterium]|nr:thioesterase family protein [Gammaproteobacteria bacterium]